ncbi:MAG: hypothetical protein JSV30_04565 [Candidatus Omnitrophota bacterium]|nr:MAG: hypothetical protein JSV30_04565 [Candidatus Omnitrophota bacterium]
MGRFITADTIVQDSSDPQSLNRYAYCRNNPIKYVDPSGHFFQIILGAIIGAIIGVAVSAATGGDIGKGAITGAIGGAFFGFVGGFKLSGVVKALAHTWAGAASGALGAIATGGDVGMSALIGGAAAGVTCGIANVIPGFKGDGLGAFLGNLVLRSGIGAAIGGGISSATGGDFAYGAKQGAISAGIAYTANCGLSKVLHGDKESKLASTQEEVDKIAWQRKHDPNMRMGGWPIYTDKGPSKTYTLGDLVSWKTWTGVILIGAGGKIMFAPVPGARLVGGVMILGGGALTAWSMIESTKTAHDLATDIGEIATEQYKEEWEEIDNNLK